MKELFKLLAQYNFQTNRDMMLILETVSQDQLSQDMGSFYHSILGLLNHILLMDVIWMKRILGFFPALEKISTSVPNIQFKPPTDLNWKSLDELKPIRDHMDDLIKEMIEEFSEEQYDQRVTYKDWKGKKQNKIVYHMLLHLFNHQTHHRGQVALLLDQLKIENDYSNLIALDY